MKYSRKIIIPATSGRVWDHLVAPALYQTWHSGILNLVPVTKGAVRPGYQFRVRCRMPQGESNFRVEALECEPCRKLVLHFTGGNFLLKGYGLETYEMKEVEAGVQLRQTVELHRSGINPFRRAGHFLAHILGFSRQKKNLRKLKMMCEEAGASAASQ